MNQQRRGKEFYSDKYQKAVELHNAGTSINEIARRMNVSYSAAYHWVKGLRKPESGNVSGFVTLLEKSGPTPIVDIKEKFPKHNELFLIASRRALPVKRYMMKKRFGEYSTWYYMEGQEKQLQERINMLMDKIKEVNEKINSLA